MRNLIALSTIVFLLSSGILLTSARPPRKEPAANTIITKAYLEIPGNHLLTEHKTVSQIAREWKGSKLSMKERIALKLFGKKIKNKTSNHPPPESSGKSQLVAILICLLPILVIVFGFHRFYLGYTWQGVAQLITMGGCGVWWLIDLIRIISGDLKPRIGEYDKNN